MSSSDLTVLRTFLHAMDAELARSALEAAGISAIVRSDDCGGMRPHMQLGGGVDLLVLAEDAAEANAILDADQSALVADTDAQ
jgi:hypothetical protein